MPQKSNLSSPTHLAQKIETYAAQNGSDLYFAQNDPN